jgi:uncharacterized membrane protein
VRIVWIATVAYAIVFFVLGADRYATFHSGADLGIFTQAIANAAHGMRDTYEHGSHWAFHFSPILYLCAPLVWLTKSALALVAIQAAATALVAPALYLIARKRTNERNAAILACVTLLYPPLQGVTFTDFHENAFAPAAVAWLLWAIDARRFAIAALLLAVVLSIKEDQAPAMAFLGIAGIVYFGWSWRASPGMARGAVFSVVATLASVAVFVVYFTLIRPLAGAHGGWIPEHFYHWGGAHGPALPLSKEVIGRLTYLLEAFVPLAFVPLRSRVMLLAIPGFIEVLASRESLTYTMGQHYAAVWIPYVLVAFVVAGAQLLAPNDKRGMAWVRSAYALCVVVLVFFSPLHLGHFLGVPNARDAATNTLLRKIPRQATIGTYDEIYAHLGLYPNAAVGVRNAPEYVIYDTAYHSVYWNGTVLPEIRRDLARGRYRVIVVKDAVQLLRKH